MKARVGGALRPALCALLVAAPAAPVAAQVDMEIRGGAAVGSHTGTAAGLDLAPRLSAEVILAHEVKTGLRVYVGFLRTAFGCEEGFCLDRDLTVVGRHGAVGVEIARGSPWLRAGLLYGSTKVGTEGRADDAGLGMQAAFGFTLGSGRARFLPGLSYKRLSAGTAAGSGHATALTVDVGVRMLLGSQ